jgi:hypothetical protein
MTPYEESRIRTESIAEADQGRDAGIPSFNVFASGPGSLAERSATLAHGASLGFEGRLT